MPYQVFQETVFSGVLRCSDIYFYCSLPYFVLKLLFKYNKYNKLGTDIIEPVILNVLLIKKERFHGGVSQHTY
jgi:hypothetical protein